jgi:hypothetical protein
MQSRRESSPELLALIAKLGEVERDAAWNEIEAALRRFDGPDGVAIPGEYLLGVGSA